MKIYNTLTKQKEEFVPIEKNKVRMYVCGPTVYDFIHIGNARPIIVFDSLRRYLEFLGNEVCYVSNFTDIDDKIIIRANELGITTEELTKKYIAECKNDMKALNIKEYTHNPLATQEIDGMISLIEKLIDKGYAYKTSDGTVYFDVTKDETYGKLSHKNIDELQSGLRELKVTGENDKRNINDFVLWKPKKEGEPYWESPFCDGRPGWHTECCVMAPKYCGGRLDIHAGGEDLIFPHHENEIAQYEAVVDKPFAKYWMHNAFLNINGTKMSKSLGNFLTCRELINKTGGPALRLLMLTANYRTMLNYSTDDGKEGSVNKALSAYERISNCIKNLMFLLDNKGIKVTNEGFNNKNEFLSYIEDVIKDTDLTNVELESIKKVKEHCNIYFDKLDDDFNTADAITQIYEIITITNQNSNSESKVLFILSMYQILNCLLSILGIEVKKEDALDEEIKKKIEEREQARKNKDYKKADEIRQELLDMGIELEDTREGVKYKKR